MFPKFLELENWSMLGLSCLPSDCVPTCFPSVPWEATHPSASVGSLAVGIYLGLAMGALA